MCKVALLITAAITASCLFTGCETPTPYQKYGKDSRHGGYTTTSVGTDIHTVTYVGAAYSVPGEIHDFTLLRAAELTLEKGFKFFVVLSDTDRSKTGYRALASPRGGGHQRAYADNFNSPGGQNSYTSYSGGGGGGAAPYKIPIYDLQIKTFKERETAARTNKQVLEASAVVAQLKAKHKLE